MSAPPDGVSDAVTAAAAAGSLLAVFLGTIVSYVRKGRQAARGGEVAVVSATFADKKSIEKLTEAIDDQTKADRDAADEARRLRHAIDENTEAVKASTDATVNLIRFVTRDK